MLINELVKVVAENMAEGEEQPLAVFPAALPYFSVRVSAICVERRDLDVFQEFILRATHLGFQSELTVAEFLGAHLDEVSTELQSLREELFVANIDGKWVLTEKGVVFLSSAGLQRTIEREAACYINGVTRKAEPAMQGLVPRRRLPSGTLTLPPVPARAPRLAEMSVSGVKSAMVLAKHGLPRALEISRLGKIIRTSSLYMSGHLLLRRGKHGVPVICAQGSPVSDLARVLGSHPGIQSLKTQTEMEEKRARAFIRKRVPVGLNVRLTPASSVRTALSALLAWSEADAKSKSEYQGGLRAATLAMSAGQVHWISVVEWHLLFTNYVHEVRRRFLMVVPRPSPAFHWRHLSSLIGPVQKGANVELVVNQKDVAGLESDETLSSAVNGRIKVTVAAEASDVCGFCVDDSSLVVGVARESGSTLGNHSTFFGVHIPNLPNAERTLLDYAAPSIQSGS
jgi:hypothetical protein